MPVGMTGGICVGDWSLVTVVNSSTVIGNASPEDLDKNGTMNLLDLAIFQAHWEGATGP